jgi:secreted PhoX family phosphatase
MGLTRRVFFREGIVTAGALAFPFLFARKARAFSMGPLVPDPQGRLDLPEGFSYAVLDQGGQTMSDGYRVPGNPDGMACFPHTNGTYVLLRNHELTVSSRGPYLPGGAPPRGVPPPEAYDSAMVGGVTRVVIDAKTHTRVSSNLVLVGTAQNCAGGPSPWGWLSCEEWFDSTHGYTFLCPAGASHVTMPHRIPGYGHFRHEGAAVDPRDNVAYLTEDRTDSAFYRFVPDDPGAPFVGRLQALRIVGRNDLSTATGLSVGDELEVAWVDVGDPNPVDDTLRSTARAAGAASFSRGEGIWYSDGIVYFAATSGGPLGSGQVFALKPARDGGVLRLVAQSEDHEVLDGPDNVCMTPFGDLFLCEDGFSGGENFLRGLTPEGTLYDFAHTTLSELAGACFSPDGSALFVNIWGADMTLVVTGPFPSSDPGSGGQGGGAGVPGGGPAGEAGEASGGRSHGGDTSSRGGTSRGGTHSGADAGGSAGDPSGDGGDGAPSGGAGRRIVEATTELPAGAGCGCTVVGKP